MKIKIKYIPRYIPKSSADKCAMSSQRQENYSGHVAETKEKMMFVSERQPTDFCA